MTDILDRLRIEAQREPHEPIWREAMGEVLGLRLRVESLEQLRKMRELPQYGNSCQWKEDEDGIWRSDCGNLFEFMADGPTENEFRFCPYCGANISIYEEKQNETN